MTEPSGQGLRARVIRGSAWKMLDFGSSQGLRLVSNLFLTRLLFPEAFGVMALVQVFLVGLQLFSDLGVGTSIVQHDRGDDKDFLDTAWTVQVIRGGLLWLLACALAPIAAGVYGEPILLMALPVAALSTVILGFTPTAVHRAARHLNLGRLTRINLGCQLAAALLTIALAVWLRSVWALVIGQVAGAALLLAAYRLWMPEARNRFHLERRAFGDIFNFGKYIFLGTAASFILAQGDRAILGLYFPLALLGVYNIGFVLVNTPLRLAVGLQSSIVFPLYRMKPLAESPANRRQIFALRRALAGAMLALAAVLAFGGPFLIGLLYDPRFAMAGPMVSLASLSMVPLITLQSVGAVLLGHGDSRGHFLLQTLTAAVQVVLLFAGIRLAGVAGAILAPGLAVLATLPLRIAWARRYQAWDPVQDIAMTLAGLAVCAAGCVLHRDAIATLLP